MNEHLTKRLPHLPPLPDERRPDGDPWRSLASAIAERALADLQATHRLLREDATAFVYGRGFDLLLELAGVSVGAAECRASLRRRGVLPPAD